MAPEPSDEAARAPSPPLRLGEDGLQRCCWCGTTPDYIDYHDTEWGRPVGDDQRLFEKICLEGFQSGLSWLTILRKREGFRAAFKGFDLDAAARFDERDIERLVADPGIIRHRGKITATIGNARAALDLREATGASLAAFLWAFEPDAKQAPETIAEIPAQTERSRDLAKALRARGFRFFGPTTAYAFMQSMGFVNDHLQGCAFRESCEAERAAFVRPS